MACELTLLDSSTSERTAWDEQKQALDINLEATPPRRRVGPVVDQHVEPGFLPPHLRGEARHANVARHFH